MLNFILHEVVIYDERNPLWMNLKTEIPEEERFIRNIFKTRKLQKYLKSLNHLNIRLLH